MIRNGAARLFRWLAFCLSVMLMMSACVTTAFAADIWNQITLNIGYSHQVVVMMSYCHDRVLCREITTHATGRKLRMARIDSTILSTCHIPHSHRLIKMARAYWLYHCTHKTYCVNGFQRRGEPRLWQVANTSGRIMVISA